MSTSCDCGDQECAICCGRSRRAAYVDPYLAAKAEAERNSATRTTAERTDRNAIGAQLLPKQENPAPVVVQVETPPVAQLAHHWQPPQVNSPNAVDQVNSGVDQEFQAGSEASIAELAGIDPPKPAPARTPKQQTPFARAYTLWQQECTKRNQWIAGLQGEWKSRIAKSQAAAAQWAAYIAEARAAYEQAKVTQPPPQPRKEDYPA